eukprot:CAMPEP_0115109622 /NCGR_PEP_ID=MMETSP0227-20121206/38836_1 /TAXON_ID=89957 /ORGANISM="Polarella glacialis, Strain CCMP 1383" /LENGTH=39 /DNA_ID= /DNA_START= /DNA_END= /DNA_ORIENTATION=
MPEVRPVQEKYWAWPLNKLVALKGKPYNTKNNNNDDNDN